MDPDKALDNARKALAKLRRVDGDNSITGALYIEAHKDAVSGLADAFEALDAWMSNGGFPPEAWKRLK